MFSCGLALAVATEQLAVADDAFALGADVDEDLVLVDPDDLALDDVAVLEALDVRVLLGEELLHRRRLGAELARRRGFLFVVARRPGRRRCRRRSARRSPVPSVPGPRRVGDSAPRRPRRRPRAALGDASGRRRPGPRRLARLRRRGVGAAGGLGGGVGLGGGSSASPSRRPRARRRRLLVRSVVDGSSSCWWRARRRRRAATVSSGAWSATVAIGPRLRRGPALLLFGQGDWSLLVVDLRPRITNGLSDAQAVFRNDQVVRG